MFTATHLHRSAPPLIAATLLLHGATAQQREALPQPATPQSVAASSRQPHVLASGVFGRPSKSEVHRLELVPRDGSEPFKLEFPGGALTPEPGVGKTLADHARTHPGGRTFGYIMMEGALSDPQRQGSLRDLGCRILGVHTWQCLVAEIPCDSVWQVRRLPFVRWVGFAAAHQKVQPELLAHAARAGGARIPVVVNVFASDRGGATERRPVQPGMTKTLVDGQSAVFPLFKEAPRGAMQQGLAKAGFEFSDYTDSGRVIFFRGEVQAAQVAALAKLDFVSYVELGVRDRASHDQSTLMIGIDRVRGTYDGAGIGAGVIDSGLAGGSLTGTHHDLGGKSIIGVSTLPQGLFGSLNGHGAHVTGTVAGEGVADKRYLGCAPGLGRSGAALYIGRYLDNNGDSFGSLQGILDFMSQDQLGNPRPTVINGSFGADHPSAGYFVGSEAPARQVDGEVWDHNQLYVFAAGNSGLGTGVSSRGVAKNALTVGSVDDYWDSAAGVFPGGMSSYSAHGTADGRGKPEVVAPGAHVTSIGIASQSSYATLVGTSMATPHVTGSLAGLVQHYGVLNYQPAALKAVACAAAQWRGSPGSNSGLRDESGAGLIDAYRMHWADARGRMTIGTTNAKLTGSGQFVSWDVDVPADATALKVVSAWIEPPSSSGATTARLNELQVHFDVEPFQSGGNTGEFVARAAGNSTLVSLVSLASKIGGVCEAARGKKLRIKVYGLTVPSEARPGLGVLILRKEPSGKMPIHSLDVSTTSVKWGEVFQITSSLEAPADSDEYQNARLFPSMPAGFNVTRLEQVSADNVLRVYRAGWRFPSYPFPSVAEGMTVGMGNLRELTYHIEARVGDGVYPVGCSFWAHPRTGSGLVTRNICVDSVAPSVPTGLVSSTHPTNQWSTSTQLVATWNPSTDQGCAGLAGYAHVVTLGGDVPRQQTLPSTAGQVTATLAETTATRGHYLRVAALDGAGNISRYTELGPIYVDLTPPVVLQYEAANGAATFPDLQGLRVHFDVRDSQSNIQAYRYSLDKSTWSTWGYVPSSSFPVDILKYGGNALPGIKTIYAEFRNGAGQVVAAEDSIDYIPRPTLLAGPRGDTIGNAPLLITGTGLGRVNEVKFDNVALGTSSDDWRTGYFELVSGTQIRLFVPQAVATGSHSVQVLNVSGAARTSVFLEDPRTERLATEPTIEEGSTQTILMHAGAQRGPLSAVLLLSPNPTPSVAPGIISLDLGNAFQEILILPGAHALDPVTGAAAPVTFTVPAGLAGVTLYLQAYLADASRPGATPIRVTNRTQTTYR